MRKDLLFDDGKAYIDYLCKKQKERIMPFGITFELTPLCNFRCPMCYIRLDKDQVGKAGTLLSADEWIEIAKQGQKAGAYKITLTGGEVFTRSDFQQIYETVYDMGFHISIISNGYLINEKAVAWLSRRKPDFIKITLYGASNETYQKVCGVSNGFTTVTSNIQRLMDNGISVVTCMTVIEDNNDDIDQVKKWAKERKIKLVVSKVIRKYVSNPRINPEAVRVPVTVDDKFETRDIRHTTDLYGTDNGGPFENCIGYHSSMIIGWDGLALGCNFIKSVKVDIRNRNLVECFKELWARLDGLKRPKECTKCKYLHFCNPCPGKLEGESGDPEKISKYVCDHAKWCYYNINIDNDKDLSSDINQCE